MVKIHSGVMKTITTVSAGRCLQLSYLLTKSQQTFVRCGYETRKRTHAMAIATNHFTKGNFTGYMFTFEITHAG